MRPGSAGTRWRARRSRGRRSRHRGGCRRYNRLVLWGKVVEGRAGVGRHGCAAVEVDETRGEAFDGGLEEGLLRVKDCRDGVLAAEGYEAVHSHLVDAVVLLAEALGCGRRGDELGDQLVRIVLPHDGLHYFADWLRGPRWVSPPPRRRPLSAAVQAQELAQAWVFGRVLWSMRRCWRAGARGRRRRGRPCRRGGGAGGVLGLRGDVTAVGFTRFFYISLS
jgi:hypothetical protein